MLDLDLLKHNRAGQHIKINKSLSHITSVTLQCPTGWSSKGTTLYCGYCMREREREDSPPEWSPGEEDGHEEGVGPDAHGPQREEDDGGGLVLGVALEHLLGVGAQVFLDICMKGPAQTFVRNYK